MSAFVKNHAKMREKIRALERERDQLKMKLAMGGTGSASADVLEVGDVQVWTPRFEGLDRKAHAAVVDEYRNKNRNRPFTLVSSSSSDEGVNVISAVSDSLKDRVKAPEILKRLGLRGGGRPDFAQGGGVAAGDVDDLRRKAVEVIRQMLTA